MKYFYFLFFFILFSCKTDEMTEKAPWTGLDWLNKVNAMVVFQNDSDTTQTVDFDYFNLVSRDALIKTIHLQPKESAQVSISIFRPEIIQINHKTQVLKLHLIPNKELVIKVQDTLEIIGVHAVLYQTDLTYNEILGNGTASQYKDQLTFIQTIDSLKSLPNWFTLYLTKANYLGQLYTIYQREGYDLFFGREKKVLPKEVTKQAEKLLNDYKVGFYHTNFSHLWAFKSNFDAMNSPQFVKGQAEIYTMRNSAMQKTLAIPDKKFRQSLLAFQLEGLIRKQKQFDKKFDLINNMISKLDEPYVEELNNLLKVQAAKSNKSNDYQVLLSQPLENGEESLVPFRGSDKKYKLLKFWFAGCAPCKKQIPFEKELLVQHKDNLTIHHFCYQTKAETWLKYLKKYQPVGFRHHLNETDYQAYQKAFDLSYAPRYVLLDAKNEVICWHCANPDQPQIENYLSKK